MRAVLFDLDGTLVDNMSIHTDAWVEVAAKHGHPTSRDRFIREWAGKKNEELIPLMLGREATPAELTQIANEKETLYRARAVTELIEVPGTTKLLERLKRAGRKLAVATAAPEGNRKLVLEGRLNLGRFFDAVVGPEGAPRGKPAPDIFLACATQLNVNPTDCVVFEDAPSGITAAKRAGMRCIAVQTAYTLPEDLRDADTSVASLADVTIDLLKSLQIPSRKG